MATVAPWVATWLTVSTLCTLTGVQYGGASTSYNHGNFMGISGTKWNRNSEGKLILDKNGFPTTDSKAYEVGDREAGWQGGWNNTFTFFKNWTFNMLWEFRWGGDVFNGTKYAMSMSGVSALSGDWRNETLTIEGVDADGNPVSNTWKGRPELHVQRQRDQWLQHHQELLHRCLQL